MNHEIVDSIFDKWSSIRSANDAKFVCGQGHLHIGSESQALQALLWLLLYERGHSETISMTVR
jgi:hypothetical protein